MADKTKPNLDIAPPGPPEMRVRPSQRGIVASRDEEQNGASIPGLGGANAIASKAMAAEQALGDLAQLLPDPTVISELIARLRAAVVHGLRSSGSPEASGPPQGMAGIVAPPAPIGPPAMTGMGMPAPPMV